MAREHQRDVHGKPAERTSKKHKVCNGQGITQAY